MLFTDHHGGRDFAKDPAVAFFRDRYFMYYSTLADDGKTFCIGIAGSPDGEQWTITGRLPADEPYEANGVAAPGAIVLGDTLHLFYQTYGNGPKDAICHAVSRDGQTFEKDPGNPVFRPTDDWCCGRAIDADVCVFEGKLFLYTATRDHAFEIQKLAGAAADLTADGTGFGPFRQLTRGSILHPELKWERTCIEAPATLVENGKIYLFYGGAYNCSPQQIGCAVSRNGRTFDRLFTDRPMIPNGPAGAWNASESGHPYAFRDRDGKAYLYYQGSPDNGNTWYLSRTEIVFDENGIPRTV